MHLSLTKYALRVFLISSILVILYSLYLLDYGSSVEIGHKHLTKILEFLLDTTCDYENGRILFIYCQTSTQSTQMVTLYSLASSI
jgi:hypothetical protein